MGDKYTVQTIARRLSNTNAVSWGGDNGWSDDLESSTGVVTENGVLRPGSPATPPSGVARWEFEQDVLDSWGPYDGIDETTTGYASDAQFGSYGKPFEGSGDRVSYGADIAEIQDASEFTILLWFNDSKPTVQTSLFGQADGWSDAVLLFVNHGSLDTYRWNLWNGGDSAQVSYPASNIPAGTWAHMAFVWDHGTLEGYINGESIGTDTVGFTVSPTMSAAAYSGYLPMSGDYWNGILDDIRIYDTALPQSRIQDVYTGRE